jgi:FAD/FMN-containing dehydrogenase
MNRRHFLQSAVAASVAAALPYRAAFAELTTVTGEVGAVTGSGARIAIEKAAVQELADSLRGNLLMPGNAGYDVARRVLNSSIDRHPALIVQPTGVADIQNAVNFARERELLLAVKCGGHSYSGKSTCDDGMQIDLSTYRNCRIDRRANRAYVAGGSLLGELDREAMAQGLVTPAGTVSHTGVGGLTLGGGFGRVARRFGLSLDNVASMDVVTADGQFRHASAEENPDLYWGLLGGGGNFGVVTSFEFKLHPMQRQVMGGDIVFPLDRSRDILRAYADLCMSVPDDVYLDGYMSQPRGGEPGAVGMHLCYSGPAKNFDKMMAPIRALGKPVFDGITPVDYVDLQRSWDQTDPRNEGEYLKSGFINEFPAELVDQLVDGFEPHPERSTQVYFQHSGGAIGRVPADATAFAHRKSMANMLKVVSWDMDVDPQPHVDYIRKYWNGVESFTDGWYTNETADEPQRVRNANYQGNYERLLEVKQGYDPTNLFRLNANIDPGA